MAIYSLALASAVGTASAASHPNWRRRRKRLSEFVDKAIGEIYAELTAPSIEPEAMEQAVVEVQQHAKPS